MCSYQILPALAVACDTYVSENLYARRSPFVCGRCKGILTLEVHHANEASLLARQTPTHRASNLGSFVTCNATAAHIGRNLDVHTARALRLDNHTKAYATMPNPRRSDNVPHHQLPWTLTSDEVIDATSLNTTRL